MAPAPVELSQFANASRSILLLCVTGTDRNAGRDQCQDHDQYSRKGCLRSAIW